MRFWRKQVAQAEVDYFYITRLAYENVLNLQISVDDAIAVTIVKSTRNLAGELPRKLLLQFTMRDDIVEHLAAIDVFK